MRGQLLGLPQNEEPFSRWAVEFEGDRETLTGEGGGGAPQFG